MAAIASGTGGVGPPEQSQGIGREGDRHGSNRAGFNHQQQGPPVEKAGQRVPAVAKVDVLSAGAGKHATQLRVGECANESDGASRDPGRKHQDAAVQRAGDQVGVDEDAGADNAADDDHRGVEGAKRTTEGHGRDYTAAALRQLAHASAALPLTRCRRDFTLPT